MSESRAYALLLTNSSTNPPPPVHPWEPWLRGQRSRSTCPAVAPKAGALVVGDGGASESREPGKPLTHVNTLKHLGCDWLAGEVFIVRGFKVQRSVPLVGDVLFRADCQPERNDRRPDTPKEMCLNEPGTPVQLDPARGSGQLGHLKERRGACAGQLGELSW
ncbi:unnamed protein product [Gadus morhua 'NCC']